MSSSPDHPITLKSLLFILTYHVCAGVQAIGLLQFDEQVWRAGSGEHFVWHYLTVVTISVLSFMHLAQVIDFAKTKHPHTLLKATGYLILFGAASLVLLDMAVSGMFLLGLLANTGLLIWIGFHWQEYRQQQSEHSGLPSRPAIQHRSPLASSSVSSSASTPTSLPVHGLPVPHDPQEESPGAASINPPVTLALPVNRYPAIHSSTDFSHIMGLDDVKTRLRDAIKDIQGNGMPHGTGRTKPRNGILLFGEPGNGKTYFAEALAGEMGLPLISVTFGDVASKWVNDTTERVMQIFNDAKAQAPCVLFLDEIDSFIQHRTLVSSGSDETNKTTNTILAEIVKLRSYPIVLVGATNFLERLDAAAIREGRFDFKIEVTPPDDDARLAILLNAVHRHVSRYDLDPPGIHHMIQRWSGYSVKRIQAVAEEIAAMHTGITNAVINASLLKRAMRRVQGRKGCLPEHTTSLDQLTLSAQLRRQLELIVYRLSNSESVEAFGGSVPTGLLFYGPPGNGKTETARALAKASDYAFLSTTGHALLHDSQELDRLMREAKDIRPCILFIDEADDILMDRQNSYVSSATNRVLTEIDGAGGKHNDILFIAATNLPERIDPAALRGGRFTERLEFSMPSATELSEFIHEWMQDNHASFDPNLPSSRIADLIGEGISFASAGAILREAVNHMIGRVAFDDGHKPEVCDLDVVEAVRVVIGR
ncbi:transitional endoplasmic reticulum ATPase [Undibacterium sp. GrIS 1.8]